MSIDVQNIRKNFGTFTALDGVSLRVASGQLTALLGPSGSGKTTLLRIIAGLEFADAGSGRISFHGEDVTDMPAGRRRVGFVFQHYALFRHMTVFDNIAFGLKVRTRRERPAPAEIRERVQRLLGLVQLEELAHRLPTQLSGGQRQRVALARALAVEPKVLLLDEPFGALDKNLRLDMQIEVKRLHRDYGITTVLVTHDQEEALSMADRIAVMNKGRIEQVASPIEIYDRPATLFVNRFVGTTNLIPGKLVESGPNGSEVEYAGGRLRAAPAQLRNGVDVLVSIRPEQLHVQNGAAENGIAGTVKMVMPLGPHVVYDVEIAGGTAVKISQARESSTAMIERGSAIQFAPLSSTACHVFPMQ